MTPQFKDKVQKYAQRFADDLRLKPHQVAGIFGNLAVESDQFRALQEYKPTLRGSKGGLGWAQWTGYGKTGRRGLFEKWCKENNLSPSSDEANYGFMLYELHGSERGALVNLRRAQNVDAATTTFMKSYERPGTPHLDTRKQHARAALALIQGIDAKDIPKVVMPSRKKEKLAQPSILPSVAPDVVQRRLLELKYAMVGKVDGRLGIRAAAAISAFQKTNDLPVTGELDQATQTLLMSADAKPMPISKERAEATIKDLKEESKSAVSLDAVVKTATGGAVAIPTISGALDWFSTYSDTLQSVRAFFASMPAWVWGIFAGLVLLLVALGAYKLLKIMLEKHQEGRTA